MESVKAVTEVFTPVSGKIVAVNETLADEPGKVNKSCYDEGKTDDMSISEFYNEVHSFPIYTLL